MKPTQSTIQTLEELHVGDRFWYWTCPSLDSTHPRIIITSFAQDPAKKQLQNLISLVSAPPDKRTFQGFGDINSSGTLRLYSSIAPSNLLLSIYSWVQNNLLMYPELAYFSNIMLNRVGPNGQITETVNIDELWRSVDRIPIKGSVAHAMHVLEQLVDTKKEALFWMTSSGPHERPFISLLPLEDDDSAERFEDLLSNALRRTKNTDLSMLGILQKIEPLGFVFIVQSKGMHWKDIIGSLINTYEPDYPIIGQLRGSQLMRMRKGVFLDRIPYINLEENTKNTVDLSAWGSSIHESINHVQEGLLLELIEMGLENQDADLLDLQTSVVPPKTEKAKSAAFFIASFYIMGHMAQLDGSVCKHELQKAKNLQQELQLSGTFKALSKSIFSLGKKNIVDYQDIIREFFQICRHDLLILRMFLYIQVQVAWAGNVLDPKAKIFLQEIASSFGLSREALEQIEKQIRN